VVGGGVVGVRWALCDAFDVRLTMNFAARAIAVFLLAAFVTLSPGAAWAWGQPHLAITRAALDTLPGWQKAVLGDELALLADNYCLIPDNVYTDKENAKFAAMEAHPGEVYLKKLHLPEAEQTVNRETIRYFMDKAVAALREEKTANAARYMGSICHLIEDFGSPSHTVPGDNQFTLLQQFLPPSELMKNKLMHGPIENGTFKVSLENYQPVLLGVTVEEASWRLLHRVHEGIINARSTTIPIMQALYADDAPAVLRHQTRAAVVDGQIVADAIFTMICLATGQFDQTDNQLLRAVDLSSCWPIEAAHLFYPQSHFFSSPYWGHARVGSVLEGGATAVPLKLKVMGEVNADDKVYARGISTGMGKALSWHLPKDTYRNFTALAGLHADLGSRGRVEFTVLGDGKPLASVTVNGTDTAHEFDCDIRGVSVLQLAAAGRGLDPKSNYAIWAEPTLLKE
jgi:hypothetical protein